MATLVIVNATNKAWAEFEKSLQRELGNDFDARSFWNIADSYTCRIDDYVMQATNFGVECPSCGSSLDNEDELQCIGCINCDLEY